MKRAQPIAVWLINKPQVECELRSAYGRMVKK